MAVLTVPAANRLLIKARQRRSRLTQRLNVRRRVRFASSFASALLNSLRATVLPLEISNAVRFQHGQCVCQHTASYSLLLHIFSCLSQ